MTSRLDAFIRNAKLNAQNAKILADLARETGGNVADEKAKRRTAMAGRDEASMCGFPIVGSRGDVARALAGVGPTDPWRRSRERDYLTRSGVNGTTTLSGDQILAKSGRRCYLCGSQLSNLSMTVEHVIPLALGGTHTDENLMAACAACNSVKGDRIVSLSVASRKPSFVSCR